MPRMTMAQRFYSKTFSRIPDTSGPVPNYISFDEIEWNAIKPVGGGAYNMVFRNNRYAVKIGNVSTDDAISLAAMSQHDLAVPVYGYWRNVVIPVSFLDKNPHIYSYGRVRSTTYYIRSYGMANVLIVARAKPAVSPKVWNEFWRDTDKPAYAKVMESSRDLHRRVRDAGFSWYDSHEGNMGYWNGKPVILDV